MTRTYVSVIGGSVCPAPVAALGEQLGELLAARGCVIVCGGMSGVMEAVARGARRRAGECVGVLPGLDRSGAAPDLTVSLLTGVGHARNLAVVASGDVVIALGGAWGTLSEIGLARSIGREVVLLESWDLHAPDGELAGLHRAADAAQAVALALSLAVG